MCSANEKRRYIVTSSLLRIHRTLHDPITTLDIVNWTCGNKMQCNFNQNTHTEFLSTKCIWKYRHLFGSQLPCIERKGNSDKTRNRASRRYAAGTQRLSQNPSGPSPHTNKHVWPTCLLHWVRQCRVTHIPMLAQWGPWRRDETPL